MSERVSHQPQTRRAQILTTMAAKMGRIEAVRGDEVYVRWMGVLTLPKDDHLQVPPPSWEPAIGLEVSKPMPTDG